MVEFGDARDAIVGWMELDHNNTSNTRTTGVHACIWPDSDNAHFINSKRIQFIWIWTRINLGDFFTPNIMIETPKGCSVFQFHSLIS